MATQPNNQDLIAQLSAQKLGQPAGAPAPQGAPDPMQQGAPQGDPAPQAPPKADPTPTNMEKAQAKIAPKDPQNQNAATDVQFIKVGDKEYTDAQLNGMMGRYKDLNFRHAQAKPTMDVIGKVMEAAKASGYEAKPEEVAGLVDAALRAYLKDPQMGQQKPKTSEAKGAAQPAMSDSSENEGAGDGGPNDVDKQYEDYEREHAIKLPPGYKETRNATQQLSQQLAEMKAMFQQVIQGGLAGGAAQQQAGQQLQQAQSMQADASTRMISNNLNQSFQQAGIPMDEATRSDFRMFSAQRGYDFPDFMDAGLAATVVADYKANKDAPEVQRLRQIAQKRQAFTGMVEGAPGAAGGGAPQQPADPMLASMIGSALKGRGMA